MLKSNKWVEIKITENPELGEAVSNYLFENGSVGCYTKEDTLFAYFKSGDWSPDKFQKFKFYLNELSDLGFLVNTKNVEVTELEDQDWNARWKKSLKPIFILPDIIVKPTWVRFAPPKDATIIEIDPQMAFGSGAHATTQLMLKLMKSCINHNQKILDIGTGSGILSIAAAKLGVSKIFACDIDPVAVFTAKVNASINKVSQKINLCTGTIDCFTNYSFDIILANINRKTILNLLPEISKLLNPSGSLILSGILIDEEHIILKALNNLKFITLIKKQQDEWSGLIAQKKL